MSDWQERITRETAPAIRAEHELRYRLRGAADRGQRGVGRPRMRQRPGRGQRARDAVPAAPFSSISRQTAVAGAAAELGVAGRARRSPVT